MDCKSQANTIWKSDLSNKIKQGFFQAVAMSVLLHGCITWTLMKTLREKARWELHKYAAYCFEQIQVAAPYKTVSIQPLTNPSK